ncbi:MAG: hypothetical protein ACU0DK_04285 [Pseudooceanicola sp.]
MTTSGNITIDGSLSDWSTEDLLYSSGTGDSIHGGTTDEGAVFALYSDLGIRAGTTIWLDTDLNSGTGYKFWGLTGGIEYAVDIGSDGVARLYQWSGGGWSYRSDVEMVLSGDGKTAEFFVSSAQVPFGDAVRVYADVNNRTFLPGNFFGESLVADPVATPAPEPDPDPTFGAYTLDGSLADWAPERKLFEDASGAALYGDVTPDVAVFAITAPGGVGAGTTIWLDTDLDPSTGYQIFGFAGGAEYNIQIGADGSARLFSGAAGETFVANLDARRSADGTVVEVAVSRALTGIGEQVRVLADVNDAIFLPNDYANTNLIAGDKAPVGFGDYVLDGSLGDWAAERLLFEDAGGAQLWGDVTAAGAVLAIAAPGGVGAGTTIWLDTDLDPSTGHQIFGFAGGAEYNIQIAADGSARLYSGGPGETFVADLDAVRSADGTVIELAVPSDLAGIGDQVRVLADVNDAVFLPNDYSNTSLIAGDLPPVSFGDYTLDGSLSDWTPERLLADDAGGAQLWGDVTDDGAVFALTSPDGVGANTTVWLDTDMDRATGYKIFGDANNGVEYNVQVGADGVVRLYSGGPGENFVATLDARKNADGTVLEFAIPKSVVAFGDQVRVFADVNDTTFLPGSYAEDAVAGDLPTFPGTPDLRVGIVYSETTAANWFDLTAYGQLVMSAQSQAMQSGLPFDLLGEADLTDPGLLATYDVLVFPGFSHVQGDQLADITYALEVAQRSGTSFIAAGNFLTNDETGAAIEGNSYVRMQNLLGVTLDGFGATDGIGLVAGSGSNPILDGYADGALVDTYDTSNTYLNFRDVTGSGEVLFRQEVGATGDKILQDAVIATTTGNNRNIHFSTDALIGNSNVLHEALDWAAKDDASVAGMGLQMTRGASLFYSRNDMDLSSEYYDVVLQDPGVYDKMLPIVQEWYERYDFVGSYYINIGANPPDNQTVWEISKPYYDALLAMGSEIGTHGYSHPDNTNLLEADSARLLELLALVDPRDPNAIDPWDLPEADQQILLNSFRFQFETSKLEIEQRLGIELTGMAVPGAPEKLAASEQIIRFFDYMSGGYSAEGAGYPGAFGYLTPELQNAVYLAPNMSFDFSLFQFRGLSAAEAAEEWLKEYNEIVDHGDAPIIAFPWHDYGPTEWEFDGAPSVYVREVFDEVLARADAAGTEFVNGADLARRIEAFEKAQLTLTRDGDVVTADLVSDDAGKFALDMGEQIASVKDWYAWNDEFVFTPRDGGSFEVTLGATQADVTRISGLSDRMELIDLAGDGTGLSGSVNGMGSVSIDLASQGTRTVKITGADGGKDWTGSGVDVVFGTLGDHVFEVAYGGANPTGTGASEIIIGGSGGDDIRGGGGEDFLVGGAGADDFILRPRHGGATIADFEVNQDDLIFEWSWTSGRWDSHRESRILDAFRDFDGGTQLYQDGEVFLTLLGVKRADLDTGDIDVDFVWL